MLFAAVTIMGKDLRLRLRDRSVLLFALVVPLGLTWLFSAILPETEDLELTGAVVDLDGGELAAEFSGQALGALREEGLLDLTGIDDLDGARAALDAGDLDAAWVIPDGFSQAVASGRATDLDVLVNPDRPLRAEIARGVAESYVDRLEAAALAAATTAAAGDVEAAQLEEAARIAAESPPAITVTDLAAEDRRLDDTSYLAAGMAAFFVFFTVTYGVTGLLEERQLQTLPRILAAPVSLGALHLGKALGALLLGLVSMTVLVVASELFLGAELGHPVGVAVLVVAIVFTALGVMALVGSFATNAEQAGNLQAIVAIVLGMLGGVFFPLPIDEGLLRILTLASPHAWFLRGLGDLVGSGEVGAVLPAALALLLLGAASAGIAALRMRRRATL